MSELNFLLRRIDQRATDPDADYLEDVATATLIGLFALLALGTLL